MLAAVAVEASACAHEADLADVAAGDVKYEVDKITGRALG
jgi:hypothetical protein